MQDSAQISASPFLLLELKVEFTAQGSPEDFTDDDKVKISTSYNPAPRPAHSLSKITETSSSMSSMKFTGPRSLSSLTWLILTHVLIEIS